MIRDPERSYVSGVEDRCVRCDLRCDPGTQEDQTMVETLSCSADFGSCSAEKLIDIGIKQAVKTTNSGRIGNSRHKACRVQRHALLGENHGWRTLGPAWHALFTNSSAS